MIYLYLNFIFIIFSFAELLKYRKQQYIVLFILIFFSGLRYKTGLDWLMYENYYTFSSEKVIRLGNTGIGYILLMEIFKKLNLSYYHMQIFISIFTGLTIYKFFKTYSKYPIFCIFIYYNIYYLRYNMGLQKQILALSFCLISFNYFIKNKFIKSMFLFLIAFSFHFSSITFLAIFFLIKFPLKKIFQIFIPIFFLIIIAILKINIIDTLLKIMLDFFKIINFEFIIDKIIGYSNNEYFSREMNIGKNLIIQSFLILFYINYKKNSSVKEKIINSIATLYIVFSCFSLNFYVLDRLIIYFGVFTIILFSNFLKNIKKDYQKIMFFLIMILYFSYSSINLTFFKEGTRHYMRFIPYYNIIIKKESIERFKAELGLIGKGN